MSGSRKLFVAVCAVGLVIGWVAFGCGAKPDQTAVGVTPNKAAATPTEVKAAEPTVAETPVAEAKPAEAKPAEAPAKAAKAGYPAPASVKACAKPPDIDGDLSDECWKSAEIQGTWVDVYTGNPAKPQPKIYVCYDDKNLYVAYYNPEPKMKNLVADATDRDGNAWEDDSNEFFVDPTAGKKDYLQFIVNTKNVLYDGKGKDGSWNSNAKTAVKKTDDAWSLEMCIPLADLGVEGSPKGTTWTANFCRNRKTEGDTQAMSWSDTGESFHNPDAFGKLKME